MFVFFFFKQKTAYEMRISDWSSDVCSSDLTGRKLGADHHLWSCTVRRAGPAAGGAVAATQRGDAKLAAAWRAGLGRAVAGCALVDVLHRSENRWRRHCNSGLCKHHRLHRERKSVE